VTNHCSRINLYTSCLLSIAILHDNRGCLLMTVEKKRSLTFRVLKLADVGLDQPTFTR
jgi:hypothetical protein